MSDSGRVLNAGEVSDEGLYDIEDRYCPRAIKVTCPACLRVATPLASRSTKCLESGMRWVGLEYREPYATYRTKCRCGQQYTFTTYTPQ